jgi:hypothetical protein
VSFLSPLEPPFTLGDGAGPYRRLDVALDPWKARTRYCNRRDETLTAYQLHSHDPRLWRVTVGVGDGGRKDVQLLRCEQCGEVTHLPGRPMRRQQKLDVGLCKPVPLNEMAAVVHKKHLSERRAARALAAAAFAALAIMTLFATLDAPSDKRDVGYLGVLLWATISIVLWVSFLNVYRNERKRKEWQQRIDNAESNPTGNFISGDSESDEGHV